MEDVYALGKTMFICMIGVVSLEVRHWYQTIVADPLLCAFAHCLCRVTACFYR